MKLPAILRSITLIEIVVLVLFVFYLVFPIPTPRPIAPYIESPLGMIGILAVLIYLFLYSNPILAVLYIFVGYELLRRSSKSGSYIPNSSNAVSGVKPKIDPTPVVKQTEIANSISGGPNNAYIQYTQPANTRDADIQAANIPIIQPTLEEEVVKTMAPVGKGELPTFTVNAFKPVSDNLHGASVL